jgi:hypothetical protein
MYVGIEKSGVVGPHKGRYTCQALKENGRQRVDVGPGTGFFA